MQQSLLSRSGKFLQDRGVQGKNVSAVMAIGQVMKPWPRILLLNWLIGLPSFKGVLIIGALCWTLLFAVYLFTNAAYGSC